MPRRSSCVILHQQVDVKRIALKGVYGKELPFDEYITVMVKEAQTEQRQTRTKAA